MTILKTDWKRNNKCSLIHNKNMKENLTFWSEALYVTNVTLWECLCVQGLKSTHPCQNCKPSISHMRAASSLQDPNQENQRKQGEKSTHQRKYGEQWVKMHVCVKPYFSRWQLRPSAVSDASVMLLQPDTHTICSLWHPRHKLTNPSSVICYEIETDTF